MITKLRKLGTSQFVEIAHFKKECPFCVAGRSTFRTSVGQVIFFENEAGVVHRIESLATFAGHIAMHCYEVTREEATAEIAAKAAS